MKQITHRAVFGILIMLSMTTRVKFVDAKEYAENNDMNDELLQLSPQELYERGVNNYLENDFTGCIAHMEKAVQMYNNYTTMLQLCRIRCHNEVTYTEPLYPMDIENLRFFERTIRNTLCLIKCKNQSDKTFQSWDFDANTIKLYKERKPYEYLHVCYAHNGELQKAASAAFTYLVVNPNAGGVAASFQYYIKQPEVNVNDIVNHEAKEYVALYIHGSEAYENKLWDAVIHNMEASLDSFLQADEECRVQCEGPFDEGWHLDFIPAIANHFTHVLACKRKCNDFLSTLNGEKHDDLLPSHYHYLQYAYFKVGKLEEACKAVTSYLLFYPTDKTMIYNMEYYKTMPKVQDNFFQPRSEAMQYVHRQLYEEKIFDFIMNVFATETEQLTHSSKTESEADAERKEETIVTTPAVPRIRQFIVPDVRPKRFVLENIINDDQCAKLIAIAKAYSQAGDGYQIATDSPHTKHEIYFGLSLKRAAYLLRRKQIDPDSVRTILLLSDRTKEALVEKFPIKKRLHYAYTHLVCRRAKIDGFANRTDHSHPVHADNCNLMLNCTCNKEWPAFTWRDYTAILYLNDNFLGGELFFSKDYYGDYPEDMIRPKCGRLVGFTSGGENLHGVKAISAGMRCALAVWFTHDRNNLETERKLLYDLLLPNK